jgi:TolB protein
MNADGTNRVNLTGWPGWEGDPRWSPDGEHIVFLSFKEHFPAIYVMDTDGRNVRLVLDGADYWDETVRKFSAPAWTPDGEWITFSVEHYAYVYYGPYMVNAQGGSVRLLTREPFGMAGPLSYSPDESQMAFGDYGDVYVMQVGGSMPEALKMSPLEYGGGYVVWSPDGQRLAFDLLGGSGVLIVNRDGANARGLWLDMAEKPDDLPILAARQPAWSPDGRYVAFTAHVTPEPDTAYLTLILFDLNSDQMMYYPGTLPGDYGADWRAD